MVPQAEAISLYGGLAVFAGFVLPQRKPERGRSCYSFASTQKLLYNARLTETGAITGDSLRESIAIGLELDMIDFKFNCMSCTLILCNVFTSSDSRRQHSLRTDPRYAGR